MSRTIRSILESGALGKSEAVAGLGYLDNPVEYIDVLESPSGYKWLQPNVLVLSTIYPMRNNQKEQQHLFRHLSEVGVAAIAIKPQRYIEKIPDFMMRDSETYHIPILKLPQDASFGKVIGFVSSMLLDDSTEVLLQTLESQHTILEILKNGVSVQGLLDHLAASMGAAVIEEDSAFQLRRYALPSGKSFADYPSLLAENAFAKQTAMKTNPVLRQRETVYFGPQDCAYSYIVSPMIGKDAFFGYITLAEERVHGHNVPLAIRKSVLSCAASAIALTLTAERVQDEKMQAILQSVLKDLLKKNGVEQPHIPSWLNCFSLQADRPYAAVCIDLHMENAKGGGSLAGAAGAVRGIVARAMPEGYLIENEEGLALIYPADGEDTLRARLSAGCALAAREAVDVVPGLRMTACVGNPCESLLRISESYEQACSLRRLLRRRRQETPVLFYDDMDVYSLILQMDRGGIPAAFVERHLARLLKPGCMRFSALDTLEAYLAAGASPEAAAERLGLHENTLKYRMKRIRETLDDPLDDPEQLFRLQLAIMIYRTMQE